MKPFAMLRWLLLSTLLFATCAFAAPMSEQQKIEALIHSVEILPGAHFIRNGSLYDGKAAGNHLRDKLTYAGGRIKTANDFIDKIASHSSMSGKAYQIRFADGRTVDAAVFFHAELRRLEMPPATAVAPTR